MFYLKNKNKIQIGCCIIAIMILLTYYIVTINSDNSMADPNWGLLEKSQVDDETIEEAIDRLIAAHDNDADAHIGAGKSLNTHKTQETVDHPAGSIIEDKYADQSVPGEKFKFSQFKLETYFESIDAYTSAVGTSGSIDLALASILLATGADDNSWAMLNGEAWTEGDATNYLKNPRFIVIAKVMDITEQEANMMAGSMDIEGFGFKIEDGTLYAVHLKNTDEYKTDISAGITVTDWHRYKAIYTSGEKIEFYVDDVLKATHTTNLPEDGTDAADELNFFTFRIFTTETANKRLVLKYCVLQQDT